MSEAPTRGRSNYWIDIVGMEYPRRGVATVHFKISAREGEKEIFATTVPITVAGARSLDAVAAEACEYMGDALHKMLGIVDGLRSHYSKTK